MSTATDDWKKLTVPQLKALCKAKKITGYSKLGKDAIIQKLIEHGSTLPPVSPVHPSQPTAAPPQAPSTTDAIGTNLEHGDTSMLPQQQVGISEHRLDQCQALPSNKQQGSSAPKPTKLLAKRTINDRANTPLPPAVVSVTHEQSDPSGRHAPSKKRPIELSDAQVANVPSKHRKPDIPEKPSSSLVTSHPVFKVPVVPASRKSISMLMPPASPSYSRPVAWPVDPEVRTRPPQPGPSPSETTTAKRFVPLVIKRVIPPTVLGDAPCSVQHPRKVDSTTTPSSLQYLDFPVLQQLSLKTISLPPSLSQRKLLTRLAILLSGISVDQLKNCAQVSRLFRYAAYISAVHRLSRSFPGRRLDCLVSQYSPNMTNMWPYLQQRQEELSQRQRIYCDSFLGQAMDQQFISEHLWTSPDNAKQATVAVRFILTWFFFSISIGTGIRDFGVVIDTQEIVEGEIWSITTRSSEATEVLYVLEATCEVVGRPPLSGDKSGLSQPFSGARMVLRADWSAYIEDQASQPQPPATGRTSSLMEHLKWTNHEEYERGISKLWLKRIQNEDELGTAKLLVAERYVLACVIGNSVSGPWMSSSEMAQEFNGLPSRVSFSKSNAHVHLFLPAHHHVESLHFTSPDGMPLHPALATIQTPGREYYILRDNGMQVGCEEEGVALVWMGLLGCDVLGKPTYPS